jgi:2-phosphosulfolactate phosphatase
MSDWFVQQEYGVRFEWGPTGAQQLAPGAACLVVVDVLSFTTSVTGRRRGGYPGLSLCLA